MGIKMVKYYSLRHGFSLSLFLHLDFLNRGKTLSSLIIKFERKRKTPDVKPVFPFYSPSHHQLGHGFTIITAQGISPFIPNYGTPNS